MYRVIFYFVVMLFYFSPLCQAAELSVEALIQGVNQARLTIQSGEVYSKTTTEYAAQKTEAEINTWMQSEKERRLKDFTPHPFFPDVDVRQYERNYLTPYLNSRVKSFRQHTAKEHTTTLFQVLEPDAPVFPALYQYKLTMVRAPEYPLDSMSERFLPSDVFYLLAYDMHTQVRQLMGNIIAPIDSPTSVNLSATSVNLSDSDKFAGYQKFSLYGRSTFRVPLDAELIGKETIDEVECRILAFIGPKKRIVHIWIDPVKDFCVYKIETFYLKDPTTKLLTWRSDFKQFKKLGDVWFPQIYVGTAYRRDGTVKIRKTVEVIAAELNIDFPKDFFEIDRDFYKRPDFIIQGMGLLPDQESSPTNTATGAEMLFLTCGPQSLSRICELLKVDTNLNELKKLSSFTSDRGTTMLGLKKAATYKGLAPAGVQASVELLKREKVPLPAIAYVNNNHFLVFEEVNKEGVKVTDPAETYQPHLTWDELSEIWRGDLLIFDKKKARRTKQKQMPLAFTETPVYDFGKALSGSKIGHTFTIKNIGQKPLEILSVTETCACTASVLSQDEIPPGKTGSVSSVLTVPSDNQQIQESLLVLTNDPIQSTLTLTLKGEVFTPVRTFPKLIAVGNRKPLQNPLTKQVSLHVQNGVQIRGVRTDSEHLTAMLKKVDGIPRVVVQLLPTIPVGQFSHDLLIDYTYKGEQATHSVVAFGKVIGELRVVPNRLFFGTIKDPASFSKTITITSRDTQPFEITSMESSTKAVKVTVVKDENEKRYRLTTTISPKVNPENFLARLLYIHPVPFNQRFGCRFLVLLRSKLR